jgi:hypothetical protein
MSEIVTLQKKRKDGAEVFAYNDPKSLLIVTWTRPSFVAGQRMSNVFRIKKSTLRKLLRAR